MCVRDVASLETSLYSRSLCLDSAEMLSIRTRSRAVTMSSVNQLQQMRCGCHGITTLGGRSLVAGRGALSYSDVADQSLITVMIVIITTSGQSNLTTGRIASAC